MTVVRDYLTQATRLIGAQRPGFAYGGVVHFLSEHGEAFAVASDQNVGAFHPWEHACFDNAYRLARRSPSKFRYVEGYAMGVVPVHHAWCIDDANEVVDPTWQRYSTIGTDYVGVVIPIPIAQRVRHRRNHSILDNWQRGWPLLRQPWATTLQHGVVVEAGR